MWFGVGVTDSSVYAQAYQGRYSLTHEVVAYKSERYSRDTLGVSYQKKTSKWLSILLQARSGYEHHYDSALYAKSYLISVPEIGIRTNHTYVSAIAAWSPAKYFYKLSDESGFSRSHLRFQPTVSFTILVNLDHSLWIPKLVSKETLSESSATRRNSSGSVDGSVRRTSRSNRDTGVKGKK
jgi:hypothetical protein